MKKTALCALCCLLAALLSGCTGTELETQVLVVSMGVDLDESGVVTISLKIPSVAGSGGSSSGQAGGGQQGEQDYILLNGRGADWESAIETLKASTPRTLNYAQVREVVFAESLARSARFLDLMEAVYALPRMRSMAVAVVCAGKASDFLEQQKTYLGKRLSKYLDATLRHYAAQGYVPDTTLSEAVRHMAYGLRDPLLPYGALNGFSEDTPPAAEPVSEIAGHLPRKSVNPVDLSGAAVTDGARVRGILTGYETELYNLLRGSLSEMVFALDTGYATLRADEQARLSVADGALEISLSIAAHPTNDAPRDAAVIARALEERVAALLAKFQAMDCDALGFGDLAVRQFATIGEWEAYNWKQRYAALPVRVRADVRIVQTR